MSDQTAQLDDLDRADMLRLTTGHDAALNELMERHAPRLCNYLFRSLQNEDDAADLAQETFVRVHQHRSSFDPSQRFSVSNSITPSPPEVRHCIRDLDCAKGILGHTLRTPAL